MRILIVIYEFPPIGGGGGNAARDICQGLVDRGHEVHILTSHMKGLPRQEELDSMRIVRIPAARKLPYQASLLDMLGFVLTGSWAGLRYMRAWRPDIIHVHFAVPSGPVAWILSHFTGIPYVLTAHLGDVPGGVPEKTDNWFRWVYPLTHPIWNNAAQVIAVSEYTRQLASQRYPVRMQVIPNGVDLKRLDPGEIRAGSPPQIVFAGRFVSQKNPLQLVRTLADLKHLGWNCALLGDGPLRKQVEQKIQNFGLEERFVLPGWLSSDEVIEWFLRSDVLFMPSRSEGLPVVGIQSLALGLAIVASRVGGFSDLVEQGVNGYLVDVENPDGFVYALMELLSDAKRLQAFREASRQIAQRFDINRITEAYENLFIATIRQNVG